MASSFCAAEDFDLSLRGLLIAGLSVAAAVAVRVAQSGDFEDEESSIHTVPAMIVAVGPAETASGLASTALGRSPSSMPQSQASDIGSVDTSAPTGLSISLLGT